MARAQQEGRASLEVCSFVVDVMQNLKARSDRHLKVPVMKIMMKNGNDAEKVVSQSRSAHPQL